MVASKSTTRTMTESEFEAVCTELATLTLGYSPDALVGIATGGAFVADAMRPVLRDGIPHVDIRVSRPSTSLKERLGVDRVLRRLPESATNHMRRIEVQLRERRSVHREERVPATAAQSKADHPQLEGIEGAQRVLIVDDTVDSGETLLKACDAVRNTVPDASIRTAVITSTWRDPPVRPDYCLYHRTLIRFSWSMDFKE